MLKRLLALGWAGLLCLAGAPWSHADGVTIDHSAVGCIVAGKYPKMNACFAPAPNLARGRVYFRAQGTQYWYFVDMKLDATAAKGETPCYAGILPKPKKSMVGKTINYYVEGVDKAFVEARTTEYNPQVVADEGSCRKEAPAAPFVNNATVTVGAAAGAPAVPVGFAVGGGVSTGLIVGGIAVVGGGTAAAVAISNNNGSTPSTSGTIPTPPTATTPVTNPPSPPPSPPSVNQPPNAVFSAKPLVGPAPLPVKFSMCGTTDPDNDPLSYSFDFGDGAKDSGGCGTTHIYKNPTLSGRVSAQGTVTATLSVTDGQAGHERSKSFSIQVDCPAPSVAITKPAGTAQGLFPPVVIEADATDGFGIRDVQFTVIDAQGGVDLVATKSAAPYQVTFDPPSYLCGDFSVTALATNKCLNQAQFQKTFNIACGLAVSPGAATQLSWTSQLDVPGGRAQLVLGSRVLYPREGRALVVAQARRGENRVEAQIVEAKGPGPWRLEFGGQKTIEPDSLKVTTGEVISAGPDAIVFRISGQPGERIVFTFRARE